MHSFPQKITDKRQAINSLSKWRRSRSLLHTVSEKRGVPLHKWIFVIQQTLIYRQDLSSLQLAKKIGLTQRTVMLMLRSINRDFRNKKKDFVKAVQFFAREQDGDNFVAEQDDDDCHVVIQDFSDFLTDVEKGARVDLVLTDPPYTISKKTGFSNVGKNSVKRFAVSMEFGEWDTKPINLHDMANGLYRVLRQGGTAIVWYDFWKLSHLSEAMREAGFSMLRVLIWEKTNPVPLNMRSTYLSNSREIAIVGVKGGKPTFHSSYDSGVYHQPIPRHNGEKVHPTQKSVNLFCELIEKHSNKGDLVIDPFLGSGTTAIAAKIMGRKFNGCDINEKYIEHAKRRLDIMNKKNTKASLFLELAKPDLDGFCSPVPVTLFVDEYSSLSFGNGGSWCRDDGSLAAKYNIKRHKEKGAIVAISLHGFKKIPIKKPIPSAIRKEIADKHCVVLDTGDVEIDHKDGRRDDPRLNDISRVTIDDFQPLSKAANNAKRQHCKRCRQTNNRFDARVLGFKQAQIKGDGEYNGTCIGCYWYDPIAFVNASSK